MQCMKQKQQWKITKANNYTNTNTYYCMDCSGVPPTLLRSLLVAYLSTSLLGFAHLLIIADVSHYLRSKSSFLHVLSVAKLLTRDARRV